jgi:hypothetical protein
MAHLVKFHALAAAKGTAQYCREFQVHWIILASKLNKY